jgi:hypothetical protein
MAPHENVSRPLRQLLLALPQLKVADDGRADYGASDPALLVQIFEAAEVLQRVIALGTSAVGQLMAYASVDIDTGEFSQESVEALGWLLAELGSGAAACMELAAPCRAATADFTGSASDGPQ